MVVKFYEMEKVVQDDRYFLYASKTGKKQAQNWKKKEKKQQQRTYVKFYDECIRTSII